MLTKGALRRGLLGLFLAVIAATLWTLRRPPATAPDSPQNASTERGAKKDETKATGVVYRNFKAGEQGYVVEAETSVAKPGGETALTGGVKLAFGYMSQGKKETGTITSDDCLYDPRIPRGHFEGHVVLTTSDGLELHSESLTYRGDKGVAKTETATQFKRKDVSGSATGMTYSSTDERVVLESDARVRIDDEKEGPTEIQSRSATLERGEGTLRFEDDAVMTQGDDVLKADRLVVTFDTETRRVTRAVAAGGVDLRTTGARSLSGGATPAASRGPRRLLCRKLDIAFRPDRTMEQVIAQKDVDLTLLPGPREVKERRRIRADSYLIFDYDEQGRMSAARGAKAASILAEPLGTRGDPARSVTCHRFRAAVDPESGQATSADFFEDVRFVRGTQRARAGTAHYEGAASLLTLQERPEIEDDKGRLTARQIRLTTNTGDAEAEGEVNHLLRPQGRPGLLSGKDTPTLITSRAFSSRQKGGAATYAGGALLRSGSDEIRAGSIKIQESTPGRRTMKAEESVVSLLHPKADKPGSKAPSGVEGRGDEMTYDEAGNVIVYNGNAMIRQGDIVTRSPKATMTLTAEGSGIETLVVGEPVEVEQGERRASGRLGTYTPSTETMVLVGDNAEMQDSQHKSKGRSLTFHVGDDRILVDGQEEGRTETTLQNQVGVAKP